ncbi:hypothetical protein ACQP2P_30455 [Dactylosporangium sp. CA-139114]|uniref:hypothetical protein n=1 Tax=Dactylosporangium sp. CA-139114 TaxID=3239931 RepID=UPI003D95E536
MWGGWPGGRRGGPGRRNGILIAIVALVVGCCLGAGVTAVGALVVGHHRGPDRVGPGWDRHDHYRGGDPRDGRGPGNGYGPGNGNGPGNGRFGDRGRQPGPAPTTAAPTQPAPTSAAPTQAAPTSAAPTPTA